MEALGGRKEEKKKKQAIKSPSVCVVLMTEPDLGSGLLSLFCSCSEEKHGTILELPGVSFSRSKSPLLSLVFQQEERQCIPQPAQGKRLNKFTQLNSHCSFVYSAFFPLNPDLYCTKSEHRKPAE